jgi:hypothetical protein
VQDKLVDQEGLTFLFEINNIRIFCGGSNWIPADNFLTTLVPAFCDLGIFLSLSLVLQPTGIVLGYSCSLMEIRT